MGVFACGWLGFVFTRGACSPFGVCAFGVGALVGWWDSVAASAPHYAHCPLAGGVLVLTPLVWALLACAGYCAAGATVMGRDMIVPPHTAWRCPRCVACKRRVGALSWCANTRAHAERKRGGGRGASWGGPWWPGRGLWVVARWVVTRVGGDKRPKSRESKIDTTGAGAIVRSRPWW